MKIGFIGQGWIGKHYADDFEKRGYEVVRYALEKEYVRNKDLIRNCEIVFIAVPTPTTPKGFDDSILEKTFELVGDGKIAVIKSTIIPGTTEKFQKKFPLIHVFHSPEFLVEKTAAYNAANPDRNIVGIPVDTEEARKKAEQVINVLPYAKYSKIMTARDAELVKYAGNGFLFTKVIFMNLLYDMVKHHGGDWKSVREAVATDPRIGHSHTEPVHQSGHSSDSTGSVKRGAGGHCFIKDLEALRLQYDELGDSLGSNIFDAMIKKNIDLLLKSGKDIELLEGVYGPVYGPLDK